MAFDLDGALRADPGLRSEIDKRALAPVTGEMRRGQGRRLEELERER